MKFVKILLILIILSISGFVSYILFKSLITEDSIIEEESTQEVPAVEETEEFSVKLSLEKSGHSYLNETGVISLKIDTTIYEVPGIDIKLRYSPDLLDVESVSNGAFETYLIKDVDKDKGVITISAINGPEKLFKGVGVIANLNVKYLKTGTAEFSFEEGAENTNVPLVGGASVDLKLENQVIDVTERVDSAGIMEEPVERE